MKVVYWFLFVVIFTLMGASFWYADGWLPHRLYFSIACLTLIFGNIVYYIHQYFLFLHRVRTETYQDSRGIAE